MNSKLLFAVVLVGVFFGTTNDLFACYDPPEAILEPFALVGSDTYDLWQDNNGDYYAVLYSPTANDTIRLDGSSSYDPEGGNLTYAWDVDGDGYDDGTTKIKDDWQPSVGTYTVKLKVTSDVSNKYNEDIICVIIGTRRVHDVTQDTWYSYIQHAIDMSGYENTIVVNQGVYAENINFKGKNVYLKSTDPSNSQVVDNTVIVGDGLDSVVSFAGTESYNAKLEGFTVTTGLSDQGIVGHWTLDQADNGNIIDLTGIYPGTLKDNLGDHSNPESLEMAGHIAGALQFDGDDHIQIGGYKGVTGTQSRTVSAWINTTQVAGRIITWGTETASGSKWHVRINDIDGSVGVLRAEVQGGYIYGTTQINDGNWHHIAVVYDENISTDIQDVKLFVDGVLENGCISSSQSINTSNTTDVEIGKCTSSATSLPYSGSIDDVRIYSRPLAESEIAYMFAVNKTASVAHWKLDDEVTETPDNTTADEIGTNKAYLKNGASITSGAGEFVLGQGALKIDGVDDYAEIPDETGNPTGVLNSTKRMSLSFWSKRIGSGGLGIFKYSYCPSGAQSRAFYVNYGNPSIYFRVNSAISTYDTFIINRTFVTDTWYHIVATFDNGLAKMYVDGMLIGTKTMSVSTIANDTNSLFIGGLWHYCTPEFLASTNSLVDDVKIYNRPLTPIEIKNMYEEAMPGYNGGGISGNGTHATISKCVITGNKAEYGGGIYDCDGEISDCTITDNTASANGGGLAECDGTVTNCTITDNTAGNYSGYYYCDATFTNNTIENNVIADSDSDGMPDWWENLYNLNPNDSSDASGDADQDGLTNLEEFQNNTNPRIVDTDGDGLDDLWELTYSSSFYVADVQNALDPAMQDSDKTVGGIPANWWYTWWKHCYESSDPTIQAMASYFVPTSANASEDANLDVSFRLSTSLRETSGCGLRGVNRLTS